MLTKRWCIDELIPSHREICHPPVSVDTKKQGEFLLFVVCYSSETIRFLTHLSIRDYPSWFQFELATFANASRVLLSELNNWEQLLIWRLQNIPHISSHLANSHVDSVPCIDHRSLAVKNNLLQWGNPIDTNYSVSLLHEKICNIYTTFPTENAGFCDILLFVYLVG